MIPWSPENPFPLLELNSYTYQEAQEHACKVDEWLGFSCETVEEKIRLQHAKIENDKQQNWAHLSVQSFQTPYVELQNILQLLCLRSGDRVVDLGCAYARMGFVIGACYPGVKFYGYELEPLRVTEALRVLSFKKHTGIFVEQADLSCLEFQMPSAEAYFLYDFGHESSVRKSLLDLQQIARQKTLKVVARGRLARFCIHQSHPWLCEVQTPQHFPQFSIYQS